RLPSRPRLRAARDQARGARRAHQAREGRGVIATDLIVRAGTPAARRRLARLEARGAEGRARVERQVQRILPAVRAGRDPARPASPRRLAGGARRPPARRAPAAAPGRASRDRPATVRRALALAARRIRTFHLRQRERSWSFRDPSGARLGQLIQPLERVGLYVPGGRAAYPSTVLMTALPARVAGVDEVVAVSPAGSAGHPPVILAAC